MAGVPLIISMKIIGITGGVGAGKSKVLEFIRDNYNCEVLLADVVANDIKEPGEECYDAIVSLLGKGILSPDGRIDKSLMAARIFEDESLLKKVNDIIHPAVIERLKTKALEAREKGVLDYFFLEAALLIECGFNDFVDEMWYIYASENVRRERLKQSRGYSDAKIDSILDSQLRDEQYRDGSDVVIDNSGSFEDTISQINGRLYGRKQ